MQNSTLPSVGAKTAEELVQQAREHLGRQQLDEARQCLEASLEIKKTAPAYRNLGNIYFMRRDPQGAIPFFQKALEVDAADHASHAMLAEAYFALKDLRQALIFSAQAILGGPQEIRYKERFILMSQDTASTAHDNVIENILIECLKTEALDCSGLQGLWYNTFTLDPAFQQIFRLKSDQGGGLLSAVKNMASGTQAAQVFDAAALDKATDFSPLLKPFFLLGIGKTVVYSRAFEDFLTALRRALLLQPARFKGDERLKIAAALSHYCYATEYIFDVTPPETQALGQLPDNAETLALRACYAPLFQLENSAELAQKYAGVPELGSVLHQQIIEERALDEARQFIPALTPISDGVSAKVRAQYEESPYPKWKSIPRNLMLESVAQGLRQPGAKVLIAGCGTGHEAAQIASALPQADILAVDLSLASLAYAQIQTGKQGFKNITFRQADILKMGDLPDRFDGIVSGGVLHHLQDPMAGWEVLTRLLKPQGLMRISLYSRLARKHITAAQAAAKKGGYAPTPQGMRAFRKASQTLLDKETYRQLITASDYYHISMYRDLLFHVQEHCFDIPGIEAALKRLQLQFLKFILPQDVMAQYAAAFPGDPEGTSLANWHTVEQANPQLFIGMYQFWCRKT